MPHFYVPIDFLFYTWIVAQSLYSVILFVDLYLFSLPQNFVDMESPLPAQAGLYPYIVLFYPVLKEREDTMRTTFRALEKLDYPRDRYRVVAIPNQDDLRTIASLETLQGEFAFLQVLPVPPTSAPEWRVVWNAWDQNEKVYWWHGGKRAHVRDLPPKKTRQLIYAFYTTAAELIDKEPGFVINYIDADSCPPSDHFLAAARGLHEYDVLQSMNVAGNLNATLAASWHAYDHMTWDGYKYAHLSANGRQPFWVLGKGLFFKARDLLDLGGFHPWITIEDPEVGLRFWKNGKRLGIIEGPLIEEVPNTFAKGVTQRKRWVCGFFQSLSQPLSALGYTPWERFKAWMIFLPCLSQVIHVVGVPIGFWAVWMWIFHPGALPAWTLWWAGANMSVLILSLIALYGRIWRRTALVCPREVDRWAYMLRVNPLAILIWQILWIVPLVIGFQMFLRDRGQVWERTDKIDANHDLIMSKVDQPEVAP
jgi:cellulose synthase/poly-beta-1,6-N-acetylglucosamine synthase-like glycosyltransferase